MWDSTGYTVTIGQCGCPSDHENLDHYWIIVVESDPGNLSFSVFS